MFSKALKPIAYTVVTTLLVASSNLSAPAQANTETTETKALSAALLNGDSSAETIVNYLETEEQVVSTEANQLSFSNQGEELVSADQLVTVEGNTVSFALPDTNAPKVEIQLPTTSETPGLASDNESIVLAGEDSEETHHEIKAIDGGVPQLTSIQVAPTSESGVEEHRYDFTLPEGYSLLELSDGTVGIIGPKTENLQLSDEEVRETLRGVLPTEEEVEAALTSYKENKDTSDLGIPADSELVTYFQNPWAFDATGAELETSLKVEGDTLIQEVITQGATYPVIADPLPLVGIGLGVAARALAPHALRAFATQTIRAGAKQNFNGGYKTFAAFKKEAGTRAGYQWHHIVEQSTIDKRKWAAETIHNKNNLIQIPTAVHQKCINSWMARNGVKQFGANAGPKQTMRDWVHRQEFSTQHRIGVNLLRHCGVQV